MKIVLLCRLLLLVFLTSFSIAGLAQTKRPARLNHVALFVYDLNKTTTFYRDVIGLDTIPEPFHDGKHTWFKIGEHSQLHIIQGASGLTQHEKNSHLCFTVASVSDFVTSLNKAGIPYEDRDGKKNTVTLRVDGVRQIYLKDPDNYWVEINDDNY